jgi:hypothetical protein
MPKPSICPYVTHNKPYRFAVYFDGAPGKRRQRRLFITRKDAQGFLGDKEVEYENLGRSIAAVVDEGMKGMLTRPQSYSVILR